MNHHPTFLLWFLKTNIKGLIKQAKRHMMQGCLVLRAKIWMVEEAQTLKH